MEERPTLILPPILQRRDITNNNHNNTINPAAPYTGDSPEREQLLLRLGKAGQDVAQGDQAETEQEAVLAAEDVREPAVDELEGGARDQERGADPRRRAARVELGRDGGDGGRHARLVDEGHEERHAEGRDSDEERLLGHQHALVAYAGRYALDVVVVAAVVVGGGLWPDGGRCDGCDGIAVKALVRVGRGRGLRSVCHW